MATSGPRSIAWLVRKIRDRPAGAGLLGVATLLLGIWFVSGCKDRFVMPVEDSPGTEVILPPPSYDIFDGRDQGGNQGFFFQPPTVQEAFREVEDFATELHEHLTIEICCWNGSACEGPIVRRFTPDGGVFEVIRMVEWAKVFRAFWPTRQDNLDPDKTYRIIVRVAGAPVGHADVDVVNRLRELRDVDFEEYVGIPDDWVLPIVFSVGSGAVEIIDEVGGEVASDGGLATLTVPPGALSEPVGIIISPTTEVPTLDNIIPGTSYRLEPDGTVFNSPATLTISYDENHLPGPEEALLVRLHKTIGGVWTELGGVTWDPLANTVSAPIAGFSEAAATAELAPAVIEITETITVTDALEVVPEVILQPVVIEITETITITDEPEVVSGVEAADQENDGSSGLHQAISGQARHELRGVEK